MEFLVMINQSLMVTLKTLFCILKTMGSNISLI